MGMPELTIVAQKSVHCSHEGRERSTRIAATTNEVQAVVACR
jgi:hypothetical protein